MQDEEDESSSFSRGAASGPFLPNRVDLRAKGMAFSEAS
jgi:hypothetical protein